MSSEDEKLTSEANVVTVEPADLLAVAPVAPPALVDARMLAEGLRYLQQRIPQFTQLTVREKRSRARAANLDPEFMEAGLQTAEVWPETKSLTGRSAEELREEEAEIRRWDGTLVEMQAFMSGIAAANLNRKHRLGAAILLIYGVVGTQLRGEPEDRAFMRPYYDNMKRAYLRTLQKGRKKAKKQEPEGAE
jgi:predicted nuclease with RNAse H fold